MCKGAPLYDAYDLQQIADAEGEGMWFKGESRATYEAAQAEAWNEGRAFSFVHNRTLAPLGDA